MELVLDPDVNKVIEFMAREVRGEKLLFVARSVAQVAELAWADAIPNRKPRNAINMSGDLSMDVSESETRLTPS
jgi:hypothetical protein